MVIADLAREEGQQPMAEYSVGQNGVKRKKSYFSGFLIEIHCIEEHQRTIQTIFPRAILFGEFRFEPDVFDSLLSQFESQLKADSIVGTVTFSHADKEGETLFFDFSQSTLPAFGKSFFDFSHMGRAADARIKSPNDQVQPVPDFIFLALGEKFLSRNKTVTFYVFGILGSGSDDVRIRDKPG